MEVDIVTIDKTLKFSFFCSWFLCTMLKAYINRIIPWTLKTSRKSGILGNLNVIFSFCREINGEKKNFCLVTNPRKKLKYRMFTEAES